MAGSDSVFHAPQNLEKGGQGISPSTMHHLKSFLFPFGKRSVSHTLLSLSSLHQNLRIDYEKKAKLSADVADCGLTLSERILIYAHSQVLFGVSNSGRF
jgi:hypothetical protein